jgi:hypothetical protein
MEQPMSSASMSIEEPLEGPGLSNLLQTNGSSKPQSSLTNVLSHVEAQSEHLVQVKTSAKKQKKKVRYPIYSTYTPFTDDLGHCSQDRTPPNTRRNR